MTYLIGLALVALLFITICLCLGLPLFIAMPVAYCIGWFYKDLHDWLTHEEE